MPLGVTVIHTAVCITDLLYKTDWGKRVSVRSITKLQITEMFSIVNFC